MMGSLENKWSTGANRHGVWVVKLMCNRKIVRHRYWLAVALLLLCCASGCRNEDPGRERVVLGARPGETGNASGGSEAGGLYVSGGVYQRTLMRDNGQPIRYTIRLPYSYNEQDSFPLFVVLHFSGDVTPFFGEQMLMGLYRQAFRFYPSIIVAPDSLGGPWTTEENEQAVIDLLDHLLREFKVDPERVVLSGFSMGGHGTWVIGGRHQDRFSALIPIAGRPDPEIREWSIPVYAIHSRADDVVPIDPTIEYVQEMQKKGYDIKLYPLRRESHHAIQSYIMPLRSMIHWLEEEVWDVSREQTNANDDRAKTSSR